MKRRPVVPERVHGLNGKGRLSQESSSSARYLPRPLRQNPPPEEQTEVSCAFLSWSGGALGPRA